MDGDQFVISELFTSHDDNLYCSERAFRRLFPTYIVNHTSHGHPTRSSAPGHLSTVDYIEKVYCKSWWSKVSSIYV